MTKKTQKAAGKPQKPKTKPAPKPAPPPVSMPTRPPARGRRVGVTIDKKAAFLRAFSICGSLERSARHARLCVRTHYQWLRDDADYHARFLDAKERAADALESEMWTRAKKGVFEPNVWQGRWCYPQEEYVIRPAVLDRRGEVIEAEVRAWRDVPGSLPLGNYKKSDGLAMFMMRAARPDKYRQAGTLELSGVAGEPIAIAAADPRLAHLTDDELDTLIRIQKRITAIAPVSPGDDTAITQ